MTENNSTVKKNILFVGHSASRTGAPIFLLNYLRWLKENSHYGLTVALLGGGELEEKYREYSKVILLDDCTPLSQGGIKKRVIQEINHWYKTLTLRKLLSSNSIDLIYLNTIASANFFQEFSFITVPVITHVHELDFYIRNITGLELFEKVKASTTHFIAASKVVARNLHDNYLINNEDISIIYEFIPIQSISPDYKNVRSRIQSILGIPSNAKVVCGSGTLDWRKGVDLFIQVMNILNSKSAASPIFFLWVGGDKNSIRAKEIQFDVEKIGMAPYFKFVGVVDNPIDYYAASDVFALMSREDPFPLVMLEAASVAKPIIYFEGSGGADELVNSDCGVKVPYLDLNLFAENIERLFAGDRLLDYGSNIQKRVIQNHSLVVGAPQVTEIIRKYLLEG